MVNNIKDRQRSTTILVLGLFLTVFVLINAQQLLLSAIIYLVIGVLSIILYNQWSKIGRVSRPVGIDKNFIQDALIGIGLGIGTIILGSIVPAIGALGIPNVSSVSGIIGKVIIITISAPIFETVLFQGFIMSFFEDKLRLNFWLANLAQAGMGSLYHLTAYGNSFIGSSASFFTAFLMFFIFGYVVKKQNSLIGAMTYHATLNIFIGFIRLAVIFALFMGLV